MVKDSESRRFRRVKSNTDIKIDLIDEDMVTDKIEVGKSSNICASGIMINYSKKIDKDSVISVSFLSPNSFEIFKVNAKVVWLETKENDDYSLGIEFVNISESDEKRLDFYLHKEAETA